MKARSLKAFNSWLTRSGLPGSAVATRASEAGWAACEEWKDRALLRQAKKYDAIVADLEDRIEAKQAAAADNHKPRIAKKKSKVKVVRKKAPVRNKRAV